MLFGNDTGLASVPKSNDLSLLELHVGYRDVLHGQAKTTTKLLSNTGMTTSKCNVLLKDTHFIFYTNRLA